jgi:hypothetical protein
VPGTQHAARSTQHAARSTQHAHTRTRRTHTRRSTHTLGIPSRQPHLRGGWLHLCATACTMRCVRRYVPTHRVSPIRCIRHTVPVVWRMVQRWCVPTHAPTLMHAPVPQWRIESFSTLLSEPVRSDCFEAGICTWWVGANADPSACPSCLPWPSALPVCPGSLSCLLRGGPTLAPAGLAAGTWRSTHSAAVVAKAPICQSRWRRRTSYGVRPRSPRLPSSTKRTLASRAPLVSHSARVVCTQHLL